MTLRYMDSNLRGPDASNEMRGKRPIGYRPTPQTYTPGKRPLGGYAPPPPQQIGEPSFTQPPSARQYLPENYSPGMPERKIWTGENIGHVGGSGPVTQGLLDFLNTGIRPEPTPRPPGIMDQSRGYSPTRRRYTRY